MFETEDDLQALQQLLDASYARAGSHLRSIWGEESRLDAAAATWSCPASRFFTSRLSRIAGSPGVAPVDGLFFRGEFWFGSAEDSARFRNLRANPPVSGVVTRGLETRIPRQAL
jgi:hypothetical protein